MESAIKITILKTSLIIIIYLWIIRNTGTFVGLTGIGVSFAGVILFLINRNPQPIAENFDSE